MIGGMGKFAAWGDIGGIFGLRMPALALAGPRHLNSWACEDAGAQPVQLSMQLGYTSFFSVL